MIRVALLLFLVSGNLAGPLLFESLAGPEPAHYLNVSLDQSTLSYQVGIGKSLPWLSSAPIVFQAFGKTFSTGDGSLKLVGTTEATDHDRLGYYREIEWLFQIEVTTMVSTTFKIYSQQNFAILRQKFYNQTTGCSVGNADRVISQFPSFHVASPSGQSLGYFSIGGGQFGSGYSFGMFEPNKVKVVSGPSSGPLTLLDTTGNVMIISPFSEFMSSSMYYSGHEALVSWGILGEVDTVPEDFQTEYIVYYGSGGVNQVFSDWGRLMREYYGKPTTFRDGDFTNNYLGYYTDNGAFYYYLTEKNKTYEQTLIDVQNYAKSVGIPYRYVQLDSWFYPKADDNKGGVITWNTTADMFPDGLLGFFEKTKWPIVAHNRYWAAETTYAKQNGGDYDFIIQPPRAIPTEERFWNDLFTYSRTWGLAVYEQDWLDLEFDTFNATLSSVRLGNNWLLQMGRAAENAGLTIQYCMTDPREALTTLEVPVISQARVSNDYHPGNNNWLLGVTSIFADSLGIAPFKDNFWTTSVQPGNNYNLQEPNTGLISAVATLSKGPVAPSDKVGLSDVGMIMRSCNSEGRLLQPSQPAKSIDAQLIQAAFNNGIGPQGQVWTTYSLINDYYFRIVLAADIKSQFSLKPSHIASLDTYVMPNMFTTVNQVSPARFTEATPLSITTNCTKAQFCLYHTSMQISLSDRNIIIYGEVGKWVPMSGSRIISFTVTSRDIELKLRGGYQETVTFLFFEDMTSVSASCVIGDSGIAVLSLVKRSCVQY